MVQLWRVKRFVHIVRKTMWHNDEVGYRPPVADIKSDYAKRRKGFVRHFTKNEIEEIYKRAVPKYCKVVDGRLVAEEAGQDFDSLGGYFEELVKHRRRTKDIVLAVVLSSGFTSLMGTYTMTSREIG